MNAAPAATTADPTSTSLSAITAAPAAMTAAPAAIDAAPPAINAAPPSTSRSAMHSRPERDHRCPARGQRCPEQRSMVGDDRCPARDNRCSDAITLPRSACRSIRDTDAPNAMIATGAAIDAAPPSSLAADSTPPRHQDSAHRKYRREGCQDADDRPGAECGYSRCASCRYQKQVRGVPGKRRSGVQTRIQAAAITTPERATAPASPR